MEKAIFLTEKQINSQEYIIDRSNYSSKILLFFINWNKENINKNNKNLLNLEDIRKLNTLSVEGSSTSSFIPLRNFSKKIHLKKMTSEEEENEIDFSESKGNNYLDINNCEIKINENNKNLLISLKNENDLFYNIQNLSINFNINEIKNNLKI